MEHGKRKNVGLGFITIVVWCLVASVGNVYAGVIEQSVPIALLCFLMFGVAASIFCLIKAKNIMTVILKCKHHKISIIAINATTLGCWFFIIYPLKYIEASVVNTILCGCIPIFTLFINHCINYKLANAKSNYIVASLLCVFAIYLIFLSCIGKTQIHQAFFMNVILSMLSCILAGFSLAMNNVYAKKLSQSGFTPMEILSVRFFLLIIITGLFAYTVGEIPRDINSHVLQHVLLLSSLLVIIPQIAFQMSIRELEPFTIGVFIPLMPVITFFIEIFYRGFQPSILTLMGILGVCVISLGGSLLRYKAERVARNIQSLNSNTLLSSTNVSSSC